MVYTNDFHYPIVELLSVQDDMTLLVLKHLYDKQYMPNHTPNIMLCILYTVFNAETPA